MSEKSGLVIEVLNGPLDGLRVVLNDGTEWTRGGIGPLSFPWDTVLGEPQAIFHVTDEGWILEAASAPHGLHIYFGEEHKRLTGGMTQNLQPKMLLRAANSWLLVHSLEEG